MLHVQLEWASVLPVAHCRPCGQVLLCWQCTMLCAEVGTVALMAGCWEVGAT